MLPKTQTYAAAIPPSTGLPDLSIQIAMSPIAQAIAKTSTVSRIVSQTPARTSGWSR